MELIREFIENYNSTDYEKIKFAWNGKHAAEFVDENDDFREQVAISVIQNCENVPADLIRDLFLEEAMRTEEAWGCREIFPYLGEKLIRIGEEKYLNDFLKGFLQSFDTFGACHGMDLEGIDLEKIIEILGCELASESDEEKINQLEAGKELFEKYINKTVSQGWVRLPPGTPVENIKVIYPFKARVQFWISKVKRKIFKSL